MKPHALIAACLLCAPIAHAQDAGTAVRADYVPGGRIPQLPGGIVIVRGLSGGELVVVDPKTKRYLFLTANNRLSNPASFRAGS